ncbi:hypothetical protein ACQ5SO_12965 [Rhodovulum sp. DZ06]|uniref:hypothetical protein n=1 Tax=Rhodovulum sp. DZ06 TaxID=3425126 RepID=UPI003D32C525
MSAGIKEVEFRLAALKKSVGALQAAEEHGDLRPLWEDFLFSFGRAIGKCISFGMSNSLGKKVGYRLKNASTKDDEGLVYLREARNAAEHALEQSAQYKRGMLALGQKRPLIQFAGANVDMKDSSIDGALHDFRGRVDENGLTRVEAGLAPFASIVPAKVILEPIYNEEKGKTFPVPQSVWGEALAHDDVIDFAAKAERGLRNYWCNMS